MRSALTLLVLALVAAAALPASPARAQIDLTEAEPADGARLDAPPEVVHLCFSEPANVEDNTTFGFAYVMPDGRRLGLRIVFQPDGECVEIFPGLPQGRPAGEYTFEWKVTARESDEQGSGTLRFQVTEASTATPVSPPTPDPTPTPAADPTPTPAADSGSETGDDNDTDGPDILLVSLITIAGVGGSAVLFTLGYLLRRRIGYDPHRPPEAGEGGDAGEDH